MSVRPIRTASLWLRAELTEITRALTFTENIKIKKYKTTRLATVPAV